jgi:hypothetical protein
MNAMERLQRIKTAEERHKSRCYPCRTKTAPTGSGLCITGFRFFLSYMGAIDRVLKTVVVK